MSPPDDAARACNAAQAELQALLLDGERPGDAAERLWAHVEACDCCARAVAHDRALRRALERLRGADRAPDSLRERVQRMLRGESRARRGATGGGPRSA